MYKQLLQRTAQPTDDYYNILIDHKQDIIARVKSKGQALTAKELNMSQTTLSNLLKLLNALQDRKPYCIYYVTFEGGLSKLGISKNLHSRLSKYSSALTIETWRMTESVAKEAELLLRAKYAESSFFETYERNPNTKATMLPKEVTAICSEFYNCPRESFTKEVLTTSDRAYLEALVGA